MNLKSNIKKPIAKQTSHKNKKWTLLILGVGVFLLFIFFSFLVHKNLFTGFDFNMTIRLQDHISRRLDSLFSFISFIGTVEIAGLFLLAVLIIRRKLSGIIVLLFFGVLHLLEIYGKTFVDHLPPPHFLLRSQSIGNFPQFYVQLTNSYPSGHSARAFFITALLAFLVARNKRLSRNQKIILYSCLVVYDLTMVISRVYLGEHWTSDVIGGSLLGLSLALFTTIFI